MQLQPQRAPSRPDGPGRRAASFAKTAKSFKQRGGAQLPVTRGDEVADLLDAGGALQAPDADTCAGLNCPIGGDRCHRCRCIECAAGTARQLMRSAASRDGGQPNIDDFTRDMGGRMVIKVCRVGPLLQLLWIPDS